MSVPHFLDVCCPLTVRMEPKIPDSRNYRGSPVISTANIEITALVPERIGLGG
jgi:hypothetical protein